jgi:hypothetical protein
LILLLTIMQKRDGRLLPHPEGLTIMEFFIE